MHRFFVPIECIQGSSVEFPLEQARQIHRVLRLKPGQLVTVIGQDDSTKVELRVMLDVVSQNSVQGIVHSVETLQSEPNIWVTLYLSLTRREKFEWMLQKCTEVGASAFVPLISSRSLVQDTAETFNKTGRWVKILREAAEQSGRGCIPRLSPVARLVEALEEARRSHDLVLIAWEAEKKTGLRQLIRSMTGEGRRPTRIALFIGPEGGFSIQEVENAIKMGGVPFSLGPRVLRMETAAVTATALVLYEFEMDGG